MAFSVINICLTLPLRTLTEWRHKMSSKKKSAPMPASSAGLLTFFNEATQGVKIKPEIVLGFSITLIITSLVLNQIFR